MILIEIPSIFIVLNVPRCLCYLFILYIVILLMLKNSFQRCVIKFIYVISHLVVNYVPLLVHFKRQSLYRMMMMMMMMMTMKPYLSVIKGF